MFLGVYACMVGDTSESLDMSLLCCAAKVISYLKNVVHFKYLIKCYM